MLQSHTEELQAASRVIEAEAKAGWFTASSWRPLLMYVLIVMLVWNYIFLLLFLYYLMLKQDC
jgi:hypothetical protein